MPGRKSCHRSLLRRRTAARMARQEAAAAPHAIPGGTSQGFSRTSNPARGSGSGSDPASGAPLTSSSGGGFDALPAHVPTLEEILEADPGLLDCLGLGTDGSSAAAPGGAAPASAAPLSAAAGPGALQGAGAPGQLLHTHPSDGGLTPSYSFPRCARRAGLGPVPCCPVQTSAQVCSFLRLPPPCAHAVTPRPTGCSTAA